MPSTKAVREWFILAEASRETNLSYDQIKLLMEKYPVQWEKTGEQAQAPILIFMPDLRRAIAFDSFDQEAAVDLMTRAWSMVEDLAKQRGVDVQEAKILAADLCRFVEVYK